MEGNRKIYLACMPGIFAIVILFNGMIYGQQLQFNNLPSGLSMSPNYTELDTVQKQEPTDKNYWLPAVEVIGLNFGVWAYNRYLSREGWSDISFESIKNNFRTGFEWDVDGYLMNQFMHPYHGANYYSSARSNGLDFWESAPYAFFGSLIWEYFMEIESPSYNDIVNTPVTGIIFGEISFRVSNLILDESANGFERIIREFSAALVNPMQGFNRLIRGEMWKNGSPGQRSKYDLLVSTGVQNVYFSGKLNNSKSYLTLRADMNYGNMFAPSSKTRPFDYFTLHTEVNLAQGDNIVGIIASGVIWDKSLKLFKNSEDKIGLYKEIDVLINTIYKLSATSLTLKINNKLPISNSTTILNNFGISGILMGGTNSRYASAEGKDYNIGPGLSSSAGLKIIKSDLGEFFVNYKRYWIHTLSGAESEEFVGLLNLGVNYQLNVNNYLGLEFLLYERNGVYKNYPNYTSSNIALRMYVRHAI